MFFNMKLHHYFRNLFYDNSCSFGSHLIFSKESSLGTYLVLQNNVYLQSGWLHSSFSPLGSSMKMLLIWEIMGKHLWHNSGQSTMCKSQGLWGDAFHLEDTAIEDNYEYRYILLRLYVVVKYSGNILRSGKSEISKVSNVSVVPTVYLDNARSPGKLIRIKYFILNFCIGLSLLIVKFNIWQSLIYRVYNLGKLLRGKYSKALTWFKMQFFNGREFLSEQKLQIVTIMKTQGLKMVQASKFVIWSNRLFCSDS